MPLQHQDISTETAIFIATKHKKTSNFFLHFEFKISNKKNKKTKKEPWYTFIDFQFYSTQNLTRNYLVFVQIHDTRKKSSKFLLFEIIP